MDSVSFQTFFQAATGQVPFPYQKRLAQAEALPPLIDVQTGAGKTLAISLAWVWRRFHHPDPAIRAATPRRLVYCLPMRNLVEQTASELARALTTVAPLLPHNVQVHSIMGGEVDDTWMRSPEQEAVLVGTQEMLLSRALNRGYAMGRSLWPVAFGLLHNDALWVLDEVQLIGAGLSTSAQLQAFRTKLGYLGPVQSVWMSATLRPEWVQTIDHPLATEPFALDDADKNHPVLGRRLYAPKLLRQLPRAEKESSVAMAAHVVKEHQPSTLSLVIVNTVERAKALYAAIKKHLPGEHALLLHSRFRPPERRAQRDRLASMQSGIVVATQVIEAGIDLDARLLVTELAPWPSLVQRFGRCNRRGAHAGGGAIWWIDLTEKEAKPYELAELAQARQELQALEGCSAAPLALPAISLTAPEGDLLRRRDLLSLFDTQPDLSGTEIDVGRFIRERDELDVYLFWRPLGGKAPHEETVAPRADELCPAPVLAARDFLKDAKRVAWRWDHLEERWQVAPAHTLRPGMVLLLDQADGGYTLETGWDPRSTAPVTVEAVQAGAPPEAPGDDTGSIQRRPLLLHEHTEHVVAELEQLLGALPALQPFATALRNAARYHDAGKAHAIFQATMRNGVDADLLPEGLLAKSVGRARHSRKHFRHELASALALMPQVDSFLSIYLVAAHHGRVRLSIRALERERAPKEEGRRYALGIYDQESLPAMELGAGVSLPETCLDLGPMELGHPQSWTRQALGLRDDPTLGPFRLAYLEAILRAADWRGSAKGEEVTSG